MVMSALPCAKLALLATGHEIVASKCSSNSTAFPEEECAAFTKGNVVYANERSDSRRKWNNTSCEEPDDAGR